ncbi:MAG: MMPL family transporter [Desulfovibrio sp.]|uniref:MMPL family transporter n=1 Tax=Desulfovibrio sp. 7SRBS1 TaxID=3378064 RepID=UPI003B3E4361
MFNVFNRLYRTFAPRRFLLLAVTAMLVCACGLLFSRLVVREDIRTMLPDGATKVAEDFALLRHAPFTQRLTITVSDPDGDPTTAATRLAQALQGDVFPQVVTGPPNDISPDFLTTLLEVAPGLLTPKDLDKIKATITPKDIRTILEKDFHTLITPSGLALKNVIRQDPLEIRNLLFPKLASAARLANVRVDNGHFVSRDGKHALVLADTTIPMTDSVGAAKVMSRFREALKALPKDAQAVPVGGHRHTLANAEVIKGDLRIILPASMVLLVLLFFAFMRTRQSLYVFLVPACVVCIAGVATSLVYGSISGIVLGFGAVLLGISVDFALHVFYALRQPRPATEQNPGETLAQVARPVVFGALTSAAAFAALLISDIPGIRQMAVFSIFGLAASLFLSLVVLPHFITPAKDAAPARAHVQAGTRPHPFWLFASWAVVLAAGLWFGLHTQLNGDLRELGYVPAEIQKDEDTTRSIWGGMREMAMIFAKGDTFDAALQTNDKVWQMVQDVHEDDTAVSLGPILPSRETQALRSAGWNKFWNSHGPDALRLIETEGKPFGFSKTAFAPFKEYIHRPAALMTAETLESLGAGGLLDMLTVQGDRGSLVMTLLPDTAQLTRMFTPEVEQKLNARLVSGSRFREMLGEAMRRDVVRFGSTAFVAIALLTALLFRNMRKTLLALLPVGIGVTAVLGAMEIAGHSLNLFHIVSIPLVMGLGADYGIFMVCRRRAQFNHGTERAVLVSGLTTLAGFGSLTMARHPALFSIGLTVLTGISAAMLTALLLVPRLDGGSE